MTASATHPAAAGQRAPADGHDLIGVRGARENNLANVSLDIPSGG